MGQHKVTVTLEIDGGVGVFSQTQEFTSGNPIYHAEEFAGKAQYPIQKIEKALKAVYGERTPEDKRVGMKEFEEAVEYAKNNYGASVFRYVLIIDRLTFEGEARYGHQTVESWPTFRNHPNLNRVEYGVPYSQDNRHNYTWRTLSI